MVLTNDTSFMLSHSCPGREEDIPLCLASMSLEIHLGCPSVPPVPTLSLMTVVGALKDADRFKPVRAFLLQGLEAIFSKAVRGERGNGVGEPVSLRHRLTLR